VDTKSETSCTTDDTTRQVEKHVFVKDIRRMSDQSPFGRKCTPLVISRAFAVVFSRMSFRVRCPVLQVSLPEVYDKAAEINGLSVLQLLFEDIRSCPTIHGRKIRADQQSLDRVLSCMSACQHVRPFSLFSCWI
jgi:hypothetical protein